jgi:predicted DNA-binding transcriptional regulator YafY
MTNPNVVRAARLLYIRDLLTQKPRTATELAQLCEVSRDTIYRDLISLQLEPLCVALYAEQDRWRILNLDVA